MDRSTSFSHISPVFLAWERERFILMMEEGGGESYIDTNRRRDPGRKGWRREYNVEDKFHHTRT